MKFFDMKKQDVYIQVWDMKDTMYSNQPGKFPVQSRLSNNYQAVMVHHASSTISVGSMKVLARK